ncbi:MAG: cytochrome c biogenesis protein CcdA [Eubacterium sp.]
MDFSMGTSVPAIMVFLQGLLSFFSPCVLPLVPLYIGYLAGGTKTVDADGTIHYPKKTVMLNTLFFVVGISFAFFLLGFGFTAAGQFFTGNKALFAKIGGAVVILFGLFQLGLFSSKTLDREHRLPFKLDQLAMNPILALVLGFTFSFAWTPCVGPALTSVLLLASSSSSYITGFVLIGVYTLGFILPFLAVGLFTGRLLDLFKKHQKGMKYTVKVGGVLMILMGVMMLTGWMNNMTSYLSGFGAGLGGTQQTENKPNKDTVIEQPEAEKKEAVDQQAAIDFTLKDQYGETHTLSDYKGKVVFLNFFATWCGPCQKEMPDIEALYEAYGKNTGELVVLGMANPATKGNSSNQDVSAEKIAEFLSENKITFPALMDETGDVFRAYGITAFPTTFMIDKEGNVAGYIPGMLAKSMMDSIVNQTMQSPSTSIQ